MCATEGSAAGGEFRTVPDRHGEFCRSSGKAERSAGGGLRAGVEDRPATAIFPPGEHVETMYDRTESDGARLVQEFDGGCSWLAHPEEGGQRASHALCGADGVWVIDPVDAPNLDELLADLGSVAGVAVCSSWHARDAGRVADRHDVAVHVPAWMSRVDARVDAPLCRYGLEPGESGFRTIPCRPFPLWDEAFLYDEASETLVVPDSLATAEYSVLEGERLGAQWFRRPQPPEQLRGLEPERILVGHGTPVTEDAPAALERALDGARRGFPRSLVENAPTSLRSLTDVFADTYP